MSRGELDRYRATQVGFVFQFYHLLPELRVLENVTVGAMVRHGLLGFLGQKARVNRRGESCSRRSGWGTGCGTARGSSRGASASGSRSRGR
jgi:ABC-type branched-subunit amino acid transport system ATPase component